LLDKIGVRKKIYWTFQSYVGTLHALKKNAIAVPNKVRCKPIIDRGTEQIVHPVPGLPTAISSVGS
jgi:hypothetical protein|tara:strand:- start:174 stop:371 length:198 start_codon:yes stop_codon:yes gene_type:complete